MHGYHPYHAPRQDKDSMLQRMAADFLLSKPNPVAYPDESFGDISEAGRAFLRRLLTCRPEERASVTEALALPWLQPVTDEGLRARMSEAAPRHVVESLSCLGAW